MFKNLKKLRDEDPESFKAYMFGYVFGVGAGFTACRILTHEAIKGAAIKSADLLLREDGASVMMIRLANGTVKTLVKEVAKV